MPNLFENEEQLRTLWSKPETREELLVKLGQLGFSIEDIKKNNYDISAKNPAKQVEVLHQAPNEIIADIQTNDKSINKLLTSINQLIEQGYEE